MPLLVILVVLLIAGLAAPVSAADGPVAAIEPAAVEVPLGSQAALNLVVRNGVNVNAFEVTLTYDQAVLGLDSWSPGDYLSNLNCLRQLNQPGRLELACTQVARPPVSGDGVVLVLVFDTLAQGSSEVFIQQAILANPQGVTVQPDRQHGMVTAVSAATFTPTATVIPTATRTPTTVPTLSHTPTRTSAVGRTNTPVPGAGTPTETQQIPVVLEGITRTVTATAPGEWPASRTPGAESMVSDEGDSVEPTLPAPTDPVEPGAETEAGQPPEKPLLEVLLWAALGISVVVLGIVAILLIRKKPSKEEDYLL